jgi:hypothetical protein
MHLDTARGSEQLNSPIPEVDRSSDVVEEVEGRAADAAERFHLRIPRAGSPALRQLIRVCLEFIKIVGQMSNPAPSLQADEKRMEVVDLRRRKLHGDLCLKLLGTEYAKTPYEARKRVCDFAAVVADHEEYVGTF